MINPSEADVGQMPVQYLAVVRDKDFIAAIGLNHRLYEHGYSKLNTWLTLQRNAQQLWGTDLEENPFYDIATRRVLSLKESLEQLSEQAQILRTHVQDQKSTREEAK